MLNATLGPKNTYKSFSVENICKLVDKFYLKDFSDQEKIQLRFQLQHYELDVPNHPEFKNLSSIADLCQGLVENWKINNLSSNLQIDSVYFDSSYFDDNY